VFGGRKRKAKGGYGTKGKGGVIMSNKRRQDLSPTVVVHELRFERDSSANPGGNLLTAEV